MEEKPKLGFVSLKSLKGAPPMDADAAISEIRKIYFNTTKRTIDNDMAHAIALLKSLPSEDARERAAVYMDGLAQMAREWMHEKKRAARKKPDAGGDSKRTLKARGGK